MFSWALTVAMDQWRATPEAHGVRLEVSYGKLVETAQRVLSALWFEQTPELHGPAGVADLAVFHAGLQGFPGDTSVVPNGFFKAAELDSGTAGYLIYTITESGVTIGQVLVTNAEGGGFAAATEYWYMVDPISGRTACTFTAGASQPWSNPPSGLGTLSFKMANTTTWTRGTQSGSAHLYHDTTTGEYDGLQFNMSESGGVWTGSMTWWKLSDGAGTLFAPSTARTLSVTTVSGSAYYITNSPLT